ncbi:MAG: Lrp/AsnC family transcriptional regulator [Myxococcota bacterium]|nr:Lrp/AsnC family transcriptional regulator [Myxococcota bacterium]
METPFDRIDFGILTALQEDGRLSNKELSARVGLAPSSCHARVRRLRAAGVLGACRTAVAPEALGIGLQAIVFVHLQNHDRSLVEGFRDHVLSLPEVVGLTHVGGRHDFLVHVAVRDARHLRDLALDALTSRPEVATVETSVVFEHLQGTLPILSAPR